MSGLLDLCNSVKNPVDHAAELANTDKKKISKRGVSSTQSTNALCREYNRKPFYSPLWEERKSGGGRTICTIKFENGLRLKLCSICKEWHPADTEHFNINTHVITGMTSQCRKCGRKKQRIVLESYKKSVK